MSSKERPGPLASYTVLPGGRIKLTHGFCVVETDLGPVAIHRDLPDGEGHGRDAVRVEITHWPLGPRFELRSSTCLQAVKLHDGEDCLPATELAPGVRDPASMSHAELADLVSDIQKLLYFDHGQNAWSADKDPPGGGFVSDVDDIMHEIGLSPREAP